MDQSASSFSFHLMKVSSSSHFQALRVTQALDDGAIHQASLPLYATLNLLDYRFPSLLVPLTTGELSLGL